MVELGTHSGAERRGPDPELLFRGRPSALRVTEEQVQTIHEAQQSWSCSGDSRGGGCDGLPLTTNNERDGVPGRVSSSIMSIDPEVKWVLLKPLFGTTLHYRLALVLPELLVERLDHLRQFRGLVGA